MCDVAVTSARGRPPRTEHVVPIGRRSAGDGARRVDANFVEQWSRTHEHEMLEDMGLGVAVGANEGVFVAGAVTSMGTAGEHKDIFGARYTGDGALLWTDLHDHPVAHGDDYGQAAAAGPGFYVLAGYEITPYHNGDVWVRRYNDG